MRVAVIVNPVAGACSQGLRLNRMAALLRRDGHMVDFLQTGQPRDARLMARQAARSADVVMAVGGDGTIRDIASGLVGTPACLMIWPAGTENIVAKALGFRADPGHVRACLQGRRVVRLDVGDAGTQMFFTIMGVGFDAAVVRRLSRLRTGHITHLSYAEPLWRTFWDYRFPPIRVSVDDAPLWEGRGLVFVGNLARYSLGLRVVRDARPDDGLLDLLILPCRGRAELIGHSLRTLALRHVEHRGVRYLRFGRARIESAQPVPVQFDGDPGGCLPVEVKVRPAALSVLLHPAWRPGRRSGA